MNPAALALNILSRYACCFVLAFAASGANAEEVLLKHRGLTLNAKLDLAPGKRLVDGAILIVHGGLAHRDMELVTALRNQLKQQGYNTLAINLSLGIDGRHGMYDCQTTHRHRNGDATEEIGVWVNWLKQQGAQRVALLGHSRGGAQTALYVIERNPKIVTALALMAPSIRENTNPAEYQRRFQQPLAPVLEQAQKLVKAGKGQTVLKPVGVLNCADSSATADAFVSYYNQSPSLDSPSLIPKLRKPTLVLVAGNDEVVLGLDQKLAPLADGQRLQMHVIAGADHTFRDLYADDAVELIVAFLKKSGY